MAQKQQQLRFDHHMAIVWAQPKQHFRNRSISNNKRINTPIKRTLKKYNSCVLEL